jgi:hypothetical protein
MGGVPGEVVTELERLSALEELAKFCEPSPNKEPAVAFKAKLAMVQEGGAAELVPLVAAPEAHAPACRALRGMLLTHGAERDHAVMRLCLQAYVLGLGLARALNDYLLLSQAEHDTLQLLHALYINNRPALLQDLVTHAALSQALKAQAEAGDDTAAEVLGWASPQGKGITPQVLPLPYMSVSLLGTYGQPVPSCRR